MKPAVGRPRFSGRWALPLPVFPASATGFHHELKANVLANGRSLARLVLAGSGNASRPSSELSNQYQTTNAGT
jgi:hypothetical protein